MRFSVIFLTVLFFTVFHQAQAQRTFTLRGKVTSFEEKPLTNISIYVLNERAIGNVTRSDSTGNFIIPDVCDGDTLSFYGMQIHPYKEEVRGNNFIHARIPLARGEAYGVEFEAAVRVPVQKHKLKERKGPDRAEGVIACIHNYYAMPKGGWKRLNDQVLQNLKYPKEALNKGIEGVVVAGFTITSQGKLENLKILKGIGYGCDGEVLRILSIGIKWEPCISDGQPVDQEFEYPVTFRLKKE